MLRVISVVWVNPNHFKMTLNQPLVGQAALQNAARSVRKLQPNEYLAPVERTDRKNEWEVRILCSGNVENVKALAKHAGVNASAVTAKASRTNLTPSPRTGRR